MKKGDPLISVPVKFGILGGLLSIVLFFILYAAGKNPLVLSRAFDPGFIIIPIFLFFGIKEFRDFKNNRELRFWQGMTVGFFNYITIALVSALFLLLFLEIFDPKLLTGYIADRRELLVANETKFIENLGKITFENTLQELEKTTAYIIALDDFLKKLFIGLFLTIVFSVILRR